MFKSKVKLLAVMACCSVLLLCSTLVFALGTQNFSGDVNIVYSAPKEFLTYKLNSAGNGWVVTGYDESKRAGRTAMEIPDEYTQDGKTLPVTEIDWNCQNVTVFTSLKLSKNLTKICHAAFNGWNNLKGSLTIPAGVTQIEDYVFFSCGFDETLTIHNNVTSIGRSSFNSISCKTIILGSGIETIGNGAFFVRDATEVVINNSMVYSTIGNNDWCLVEALDKGSVVKVLKSADNRTNSYMNNTTRYKRTTSGSYYVYTRLVGPFE